MTKPILEIAKELLGTDEMIRPFIIKTTELTRLCEALVEAHAVMKFYSPFEIEQHFRGSMYDPGLGGDHVIHEGKIPYKNVADEWLKKYAQSTSPGVRSEET